MACDTNAVSMATISRVRRALSRLQSISSWQSCSSSFSARHTRQVVINCHCSKRVHHRTPSSLDFYLFRCVHLAVNYTLATAGHCSCSTAWRMTQRTILAVLCRIQLVAEHLGGFYPLQWRLLCLLEAAQRYALQTAHLLRYKLNKSKYRYEALPYSIITPLNALQGHYRGQLSVAQLDNQDALTDHINQRVSDQALINLMCPKLPSRRPGAQASSASLTELDMEVADPSMGETATPSQCLPGM